QGRPRPVDRTLRESDCVSREWGAPHPQRGAAMPGADAQVGGRFVFVLPWVIVLAGCGGGGGGPHAAVPQIPSGAVSTVTVSRDEGLAADGVDESIVVITARDTLGHAISGLSATIAASGANNVVTQPFGVTNPLGATSGRVAATSTGA